MFFEMLSVIEALLCSEEQGRESRLIFANPLMKFQKVTSILPALAPSCAERAPAPANCNCGVPARNQSRIVGGQAADQNEYPWQVALIRLGDMAPFCGGTIISDDTILTAAHCNVIDVTTFRVVVGEHDYTDSSDGQVSIAPCSWVSH